MTVGTSHLPRPALGDEEDSPGPFRDRDLPQCLHPRACGIKLYRKECREACCSIPRMFGGLRGEPGRTWERAWRPAGETAAKRSLISLWPLMPLWRRPGGSACPEPLLPALFSATCSCLFHVRVGSPAVSLKQSRTTQFLSFPLDRSPRAMLYAVDDTKANDAQLHAVIPSSVQ